MTYVLKDHAQGYFRGTIDGGDVVWTWSQGRAMRFRDRWFAEIAMVGHCPDAVVVRLRPKERSGAKP